ncbi:DUF5615 family PIN-like protein [Telluribacter sp.]|jgi:predicted nuclease of predicted toxin-antitoxin system|uniref:DUF5615 family PIN-like protein n=1 Tax=Telluribacter sp. TaxID=1978767 RepID=UPI002E12FBC1|nr:DUF5615 family PIN-like protein [Telluribacter sp.]
MKVLLDENIDVRFKKFFTGTPFEVYTVRDMEWNGAKNGQLLKLASEHQFDVFVCVDKNLPYQQNLSALPLPVVIIDVHRNILPQLQEVLPGLFELLEKQLVNQVYIVR